MSFKTGSRLMLAEFTGAIGAAVLGAGVGISLASHLSQHWVAISLVGLILHAWGMFDKHRLEKSSGQEGPVWAVVAYWVCWILLAILFLFLTTD